MKDSSSPTGALRLRVQGRVQGVGFRYSTIEVARRFRVTGYVMNLPDGSVEIVAEGEPAELTAFLDAVRRMPVYRNVTGEELGRAPPTGRYADFRIRFS
ncbi:MAG: acylphosphatase [Kiritimatiellae bacterium]|nr:acylphosphatase [Kiritimatiellia bacterium]